MELIFVRHGLPRWSVDGLSQSDPHLTAEGRKQAELTATRLAADSKPVAEVIVSPTIRSRETAAPIARLCGINPQVVPELTEIRMPDWTGFSEGRVRQIFEEARHRHPDDWWQGIPGGESFVDFHERVTGALIALLAERSVEPEPGSRHIWRVETDPRRIVVVAHAGTNAVAVGFFLGLDPVPWEWERFLLGHASITHLRTVPLAGGHIFSLRGSNDLEHIPPDLRSR